MGSPYCFSGSLVRRELPTVLPIAVLQRFPFSQAGALRVRRAMRQSVVLLIVALFASLSVLGLVSLPDPSWLAAICDEADGDDANVILASQSRSSIRAKPSLPC